MAHIAVNVAVVDRAGSSRWTGSQKARDWGGGGVEEEAEKSVPYLIKAGWVLG